MDLGLSGRTQRRLIDVRLGEGCHWCPTGLCSWPVLMKSADNRNLGNKKHVEVKYTNRFRIWGKGGFSHCNCNVQSIEEYKSDLGLC